MSLSSSSLSKLRNSVCRTLCGLGVVTVTGLCALSADAAVYTRFDTGFGDWAYSSHGSNPANPPSIKAGPGGANALVINRPSGGGTSDNAFVYYNGTDGGATNSRLSDFSLTSTFSLSWTVTPPPGSTTFGYMIRASSNSYASTGYYIALSLTGTLSLFDSPTSHTLNGTLLDSVTLSFDPNEYYQIKISAVGQTISASIWSEDGTTLIDGFSYTDSSVRTNEGYFGVRSGMGNSGVSQYVRDVSFEAIPEPGTVAFTLLGGGALLAAMRRRKSVGRS